MFQISLPNFLRFQCSVHRRADRRILMWSISCKICDLSEISTSHNYKRLSLHWHLLPQNSTKSLIWPSSLEEAETIFQGTAGPGAIKTVSWKRTKARKYQHGSLDKDLWQSGESQRLLEGFQGLLQHWSFLYNVYLYVFYLCLSSILPCILLIVRLSL